MRDIGRVLPSMQAMVVYAHYGSGALKDRATENVVILLSDLHTNERLLKLLVRRYFRLGHKQRDSLRTIAKMTGTNRRRVTDLDATVFRLLTVAMEQCESRLSDYFLEKGLVQGR